MKPVGTDGIIKEDHALKSKTREAEKQKQS